MNRKQRRNWLSGFRKSKGLQRKKAKGAFGNKKHIGRYRTLHVIPRSKRTDENCNANGVDIKEISRIKELHFKKEEILNEQKSK